MRASAACAIAAALVAGCALQQPPDRESLRSQALPNWGLPPQWASPGANAGAPVAGWIASFDDPVLNILVTEAVTYNADLRVASARVEQAMGYVKVSGASLLPAIQVVGHGGVKQGSDGSGLQGIFVSASWEIDVWGRIRYGRDAAQQQQAATQADFAYARASLAALVAKGWFLASEARQQRALAAGAVRDAERLHRLAVERQRIGRGDATDVALASANTETLRDAASQADLAYSQAVRALEALLGRYPAAAIEARQQFAALPPPIPSGLPSELLERRPDVIAAERRVAAAFDRVLEAKAAMLPRIALTAGVSNVSSDLFVLKNHENPMWSAGANLIAPLYQGGALEANVEIRTAEQKQAVAEYARIAQRAFGEVEGALSAETATRDRTPMLARAVAENLRAVELAGVRLRVGSGDQRGVLQQQLALYGAQSALLRVQGEQRVQRVNLHLALGGDFGANPPAAAGAAAQVAESNAAWR